MNADNSDTIKDREVGFQFRSRVRITSLLREYATPTITPITLKSIYRPHKHIL